jgi:hypothetical protein
MPIEYTNSVGTTYRLLESKTKKGRPHYHFSSNPESKGKPVKEIPEGFEIYEHPATSQVYLRKKRPQLVTDLEKQLVEARIGKLKRDRRYRVDCKDKDITIYESDANVSALQNVFGNLFANLPMQKAGLNSERFVDSFVNAVNRHYTAVMRFRLVDEKRRTFAAERFCFRGSIDDWIHIGGPDRLEKLVKRYVKYLGTDDFYEIVGF